jgi:hypothetical protein
LRIENEFILKIIERNQRGQMFAGIWIMSRRRKSQIQSKFETKFCHIGDYSVEKRTGTL